MLVVCAGRSENIQSAVPIGVGLIESSVGLTTYLTKRLSPYSSFYLSSCSHKNVDNIDKVKEIDRVDNINRILFVGTAGAYNNKIPLLSLCYSFKATQIESSSLKNNCYTPIENKIEAIKSNESNKSSTSNMPSMPNDTFKNVLCETLEVVVNSSNYITTNPSVARKMLECGVCIENMEFFSVLYVARVFKIPAFGLFCVTNYCNANAHSDFLANHNHAKTILENFMSKHYRALYE